jgi:uncharacterized protein (TIGR03086 family)
MQTSELIALNAAAVRHTVRLLTDVTDLSVPTPCAGWDLRALLTHMTVQHRGFTAAARGRGADPAVWQSPSPSPDPVRGYAASADLVIAAFAEPGVLDRPFALPEIAPDRPFPGRVAVGFHLVDYVVHGWDVARALGRPFTPDPLAAAAALRLARAVPTGPARLTPGAAFAPAREVPAGADPLTETLLLLGRDPAWTPTA